MGEKYDLARMMREISEEETANSDINRQLTQDEIKRMVAEKKKPAVVAPTEAARNLA